MTAQSPQIITREVDVSTVAPSISSSIAAIVGGAIKGPVNEATFISSPDQFVETFGQPITTSYLGYTAINFLRQGNQLWVNRVASLAGTDPVATANTDTRASIQTAAIATFNVTGNLVLLVDGTSYTVNLSPATSNTVANIVSKINTTLATVSPRAGFATVVDGTKIKVETQSKNGLLSTISVVSSILPEFVGLSGDGARTVTTAEALTAASVTSSNNSATIDTTVVYASITGDPYTAGTLYNVSKFSQEAYGVVSVGANNFTVGLRNSAVITLDGANLAAYIAATFTFQRADLVASTVLTFVNAPEATGKEIRVDTLASLAELAEAIADRLNRINESGTSTEDGTIYPRQGVRAVASGNTITLTQIHPNATFGTYGVTVVASAASLADIDNGVDAAADLNAGAVALKGGTTGTYVRINVPSTYLPAGGVNVPEKNIDYFFMADDAPGFVVGGSFTLADIAQSLAQAIDQYSGYYATGLDAATAATADVTDYVLAASANSNRVTISSQLDGHASGNGIAVTFVGNTTGLVATDLGGSGELQHGFNDRSGLYNTAYAFGSLVVDGTTKTINFDTVSTAIIPDKHEATLAQIVDAINNIFGLEVAQAAIPSAGNEALRISAILPGSEGTVTAYESSNFDTSGSGTQVAQANPDLLEDAATWVDQSAGTPTTGVAEVGTGDNHVVFVVDDTLEVDVLLTQDAALTLAQAVSEINLAAEDVSSTLATVATVNGAGTNIVLTSPTGGSYADFGSSIQVTNGIAGVFADLTLKEGTGAKNLSITLTATTPGTWANDVVTVAFTDENPLFSPANSSRMDVYSNNILVETFRELVVNPEADGTTGADGEGTFIESAVNGASEFVTVDFDDDVITDAAPTLLTSVKIVANTSSVGSNPPYALSGGADGLNGLADSDVIGVAADASGNPTGLQVYADPERIFVNLLAAPGFTSQAVGNALVTLAEAREDTLAFIDPPLGLKAQEMVDWHNGQGHGRTAALNSSYAATYNTWLEQYDPYNDINISLPPSSFLLAQMAYNDSIAEPWFATAGLTRGRLTSALDVVSPTSLGDRELLYGQGNRVNPIPKFVQEGIVIWGNRTLYRQESALKEITVRRLLNYAKVVVGLGSKVILFEPNDPSTVKRLLDIINPVLYGIRTRRGLTQFRVVDATTDRDRNLNRLVVRIFLQPTRTVEIIDLPFVVTASGGSFTL